MRLTESAHTQLIRFMSTASLAAGAKILSRIWFGYYVNYLNSIILGQLFGMGIAYILFRTLVFSRGSHSMRVHLTYFVLINLLGFLVTLSIAMFCDRVVFASYGHEVRTETLAHFIGIVVATVASYVGHKHVPFK